MQPSAGRLSGSRSSIRHSVSDMCSEAMFAGLAFGNSKNLITSATKVQSQTLAPLLNNMKENHWQNLGKVYAETVVEYSKSVSSYDLSDFLTISELIDRYIIGGTLEREGRGNLFI